MTNKTLKFYDLKKKKAFNTAKYDTKVINTSSGVRKQAVTIAPSGATAVRFVSDKFKKNK